MPPEEINEPQLVAFLIRRQISSYPRIYYILKNNLRPYFNEWEKAWIEQIDSMISHPLFTTKHHLHLPLLQITNSLAAQSAYSDNIYFLAAMNSFTSFITTLARTEMEDYASAKSPKTVSDLEDRFQVFDPKNLILESVTKGLEQSIEDSISQVNPPMIQRNQTRHI